MGLVDDVVLRLATHPEPHHTHSESRRIRAPKPGDLIAKRGSSAPRSIVDSAVLRGPTSSGSFPSADSAVPNNRLHGRPDLGPNDLISGFAVVHANGPAFTEGTRPSASSPPPRVAPDLRRHAVGARDLGRAGVTPVEMSASARPAPSLRGRLIAAIDDCIADALSRHTAGLIRQGIVR